MLLVRGVQGEEHIHVQQPHILALLETHISGNKAREDCNKIGYYVQCRVEAQGFQGGIWVLWDTNEVSLTPVKAHQQFITMEVKKRGARPWLFTAVYTSPHVQNRD